MTTIILTGGKSKRMGYPKEKLPIGNTTFLDHIINQVKIFSPEILISSNGTGVNVHPNATIIYDEMPDRGPLMGLFSCLKHSTDEVSFLISCDSPIIPMDLVHHMKQSASDVEAVVLVTHGKIQPCFAMYRKSILPKVEFLLETHQDSFHGLLSMLHVCYTISIVDEWYKNINTPSDYAKFKGEKNHHVTS